MIRAILFDFNGVIVDDEPIHFLLFQEVLKEEGVELTRDVYYTKYLGMDDYDCLSHAIRDSGKGADETAVQKMIDKKNARYKEKVKANPPMVPGAVNLIQDLAKTHYLAIVSGALRNEIEFILDQTKLREAFSVILGAEDMQKGKPDPEGYEKAMLNLNRDVVASADMLLPSECLVLEDSIWGIQAATAAGMDCGVLTTSFKKEELPGAKFYLKDFEGVGGEDILKILNGGK